MFLPTTHEELNSLKLDKPDVMLVIGDSYIDSTFTGKKLFVEKDSRSKELQKTVVTMKPRI